MNYKNISYKLAVIFTVTAVSLSLLPYNVFARTSADVENEINEKKEQLDKAENELQEATSDLNAAEATKNSVEGRLGQLRADIEYIDSQLKVNIAKTKTIKEEVELKRLEEEKNQEKLSSQLVTSYVYWQAEGKKSYATVFNSDDPVKTGTYYAVINGNQKESLQKVAEDLNETRKRYETSKEETDYLRDQSIALEEEKRAKEAEIAGINQRIEDEAQRLAAAQSTVSATQSQIEELTEEQKALQEYEESLIGDYSSGGTREIQTGEYYFTGTGRDAVQGHGLGFSQNGALGAANAGWNYKQIIEFYYPGATTGKVSGRTMTVQGVSGTLTADQYVAGLGEVPSTSCEDLGVEFGEVGYWGCWPEDAILAQVVVARSYGVTSSQPICTTAACQVYVGGDAKKWAAEATSDEYVVTGGNIIRAFYSSQNNQGGGTADHASVWPDGIDGSKANPYSYLKNANDNNFYYPAAFPGCGGGDCARWGWRTNSYKLTEIQQMLQWTATTSSYTSSNSKTYIESMLSSIGKLESIGFEKDPSGRVGKIVFNGSTGSGVMAGSYFKSYWNIWVDSEKPSGETDFIYSLTYSLLKG